MSNTKNQSRFSLLSIFKFAIGWPLSAVALFFIGKIVVSNAKTLVININQLNFLLLFSGLFCFLLYYFIRVITWKIILKEQGYDVPLKTASFLWGVAELRRFVPGKFWSFLSRATLFSSINIPKETTIKALIVETESFLLAGLIISVLGAIFYPNSLLANVSYTFLIVLIIILTIAAILFINVSLISKFTKGRFLSKITLLLPKFPPRKNILILFLSVLYLFLFGFGTYLTTTSLTFISPEYFLELSIFFVFALLVGYLSFLTPMGLGVRESVIIVGLSQFVSISTAGVVSIYARVALIFSDLLFLLFTYLWKTIKNKLVNFLENFVVAHKHVVILGVFVTIYMLYFTTTSFLRYDNFYTGRFDLGNMDQTVWNTIHGRIFELTDPNGIESISRLAFHADFILILLAPFYLLWEDPRMLLLIQTVVLAVGSIFIYKIAINVIKNKNFSLLFAVAFLLNPAVQYTNLYDFHPVTLATTFLLGTFYFLLNKRYGLFLLFGFFAVITKEQVWIVMAFFGLYILFRNVIARSPDLSGRRSNPTIPEIASQASPDRNDNNGKKASLLFGATIFIASVLVFYLLIWHAIPSALGSEHFALSYYSDFGDSPANILKNIFVSPHKILETITQKNQLHYLHQLFVPLGFLSLLSPLTLIFALPDLFINLLSNKPQLHQIYYQYSATITPFIFIAAIFSIKNLITWFPKLPYALTTFYVLLATCYSVYSFGPLPFSKSPNIDMFTKPQENKIEIENYLSKIPNNYSVSATNNIGSHLSQRQEIFTIPNGIDRADFIIFLIDKNAKESFENEIKMVESDKNYKQTYKINDFFIVFEKQTAP